MVITKDSESFDPGSSPGRTFWFFFFGTSKKNCIKSGGRLQRFRVHSSAVERRIADPEVAGSIPAAPLIFLFTRKVSNRVRNFLIGTRRRGALV